MSRGVRSSGPSGEDLLAEMRSAARAAGVSLHKFALPLFNDPNWHLEQLRIAKAPTPLTIARVRALIAGEPIPPPRQSPFKGRFGGPSRLVTGERTDNKIQREARQAMGERAREERRPGETLADAVRRIGREIEAEERAAVAAEAAAAETQRDQALAELASPSSLIQRAQRDWPAHSASVAAIASSLGIAKGEAWSRVIAAGIDTLNEGAA